MDNKDILIVAQVVFKGFVETEKRLPENDEDTERLKSAILKTWKASYLAQQEINKIVK